VRCRSKGRKGEEGRSSPAGRKSGEAVLELNSGEVPASGDGDGVADEVRTMTAVSKT
jgi:hypothetical protein